MTWWTQFLDWLYSEQAQPAIWNAIFLASAILLSTIFAALIARGFARGLTKRLEKQELANVLTLVIDAATEASAWNSLTPNEQLLSNRAIAQAQTRLQLLPIRGASEVAAWSTHQLAEIKRASAGYGYQLEPIVDEFRARLIEWQNKPRRAKKIFGEDIARWSYTTSESAHAFQEQSEAPWINTATPVQEQNTFLASPFEQNEVPSNSPFISEPNELEEELPSYTPISDRNY